MDETIDLILQGCQMAKSLEGSLPNMTNQPESLISSCDEIIRAFSRAKESISKAQLAVLPESHKSQLLGISSGVQEWLRDSSIQTRAMDLLRAQQLLPDDTKLKGAIGGGLDEMVVDQMGGGGRFGGRHSLERAREIEPPAVEAASSGGGRASSSQRQRKRCRDGGVERRVERVPAPQMGNTEIPPEDGYTWRKYGQKDILNSRFPRSYFRCTHQKLYQCPAKKLVQRLDDDPNIFEVTYRGDHTCHLSSTAPSVPPPLPVERREAHSMMQQATAAAIHSLPNPTTNTTLSMSQWLTISDFGLAVAGGGVVGSTSSTVNMGSSTSGGAAAGPSTSRYGRDVDYPVADMADVMFNSGSSSSTSMDLIFSSMDDKWPDSADKKN
ncbi:WRKY transcription factor 55 [Coffea eugenioides]|uniref:WRKY transcription factor 55 n=1 Tax=Coffea eugenioides TaxID=49369 RepID=UPI000F60ED20|nr:WRKY transcription factor 55 [Coffea eugenioides]